MQAAGSLPRKKLVSGWVWVVLAVFAVWVVAAIVVDSLKSPQSPAQLAAGAPKALGVGDWGRLENGAEADVVLGVDQEALKALAEAEANDDTLGYLEVLASRRAFPVARGTLAKITAAGKATFMVEVMDGDLKGYKGWVAAAHLKPAAN